MSDDMSGLYSRVMSAVISAPALKINFYAVYWPINAGAFVQVYTEIAKHVMSKRQGIEICVGEVPEGAGALYHYLDDAYVFPRDTFGATVLEQSLIVHESVHAWVDLLGYISWASDADNEAAAYVTQSLFCLYATGRGCLDLQDQAQLTWDRKAIFGIADRIARSIKDTATAKVSDSDRQVMVDAVVASPVYQRNKTTRHTRLRADGINEDRPMPSDYLGRRGI